ncbi:MAG: DNA polymerase III subunit epsilon [Alphaproteobacteria bacterium]
MREIVFDTETTGFRPEEGDKLVEIGAVELINHLPTGKVYHQYINPNREVPEDAYKVHGLNYEFLKDFPSFNDIAQEFLDFVDGGILIAHNANFDMKFLQYELKHGGFKQLDNEVIDTLQIARNKFPGAKASLDALVKRFNIGGFDRSYHGALLDSQILAKVYLELIGGSAPTLEMETKETVKEVKESVSFSNKIFREARVFELSDAEKEAHEKLVAEKLKKEVW